MVDNIYFSESEILPFTKSPPPCPKCSSQKVKRTYHPCPPGYSDRLHISETFSDEWLECFCEDCRYEWPQRVKGEKRC